LVAGLEWSQTFQPFAAGRFRSSTIPALQKPDKNSHDRIRIVGRGCTPGGLLFPGLGLTGRIVGLEWSQTFQPFPAGRFRSSTIPALQKPDKNSHDRIRIVGRGCTPGGLLFPGLGLTGRIVGLEWSQTFQPFPAGRFRSSTIPALQKPDKKSHERIRIGLQGWNGRTFQISGLNSLKISEIVGCPNAELKKSNDLLTTTALSWSF